MRTIAFMPLRNMLDWEAGRICGCVREAGYDAIEVQSSLLCGPDRTPQSRKEFMDAAAKEGLIVSGAVLQRDFVLCGKEEREKQLESTLRDMRIIADAGIDLITMCTGPFAWIEKPVVIDRDVSSGTAWAWVYQAYDQLIPQAEKLGVRIGLENVWGMLAHNLYTNQFLHKRYNSKAFGVTLDPSHDAINGLTDMKFLVETWGKEKIFHVHLKDAVGTQETGKFLFPLLGEGVIDWCAFFGTLEDIGYEGAMSVEFESWGYVDKILGGHFELAASFSREAVEKLMK